MKSIEVTSSNGKYLIQIEVNCLQKNNPLKRLNHRSQVVIITSKSISAHFLEPLLQSLDGIQAQVYSVPDTEDSKSLRQYSAIIDFLVQHYHNRETTLIALGGGMINDLTGFVASTFHRGIPYISIPTTLLSQVDASIGGKTALNHPQGKNLIGTFYPPKNVIIDPLTLKTLPDRIFRAGIAEMIKIALVADAKYLTWLEKQLPLLLTRDPNALETGITTACRLKAKIVAADEKEHGQRLLLNLGHTFAHALEQQLGYGTWQHGEAVASGLWMAAQLSQHLNMLTLSQRNRIQKLLKKTLLLNELPSHVRCESLINAMKCDKKSRNQGIFLVLLDGIGTGRFNENVDALAIKQSVRDYQTFAKGLKLETES